MDRPDTTRRHRPHCPVSVLLDAEPHPCLVWLPSCRWICTTCGLGGHLEALLRLDTDVPQAISGMAYMAESPRLPDEFSRPLSHRSSLQIPSSSKHPTPQTPCPLSALIDPEPHGLSFVSSSPLAGPWCCSVCELFGNRTGFLRLTANLAGRFLRLATTCRSRFLPDELTPDRDSPDLPSR